MACHVHNRGKKVITHPRAVFLSVELGCVKSVPRLKCYNYFMNYKEILKFLSGFQAAHLLSHIYAQYALTRGFLEPHTFNFRLFQITLTSKLNSVAIVVNLILLALFLHYAYFHKPKK